MDISKTYRELTRCFLGLVLLGAALGVFIHAAPGRTGIARDEAGLVGTWTGESICQIKASACHDEKVVYHISKGSDADHVVVSADKIVDGKAVNMGQIDFAYDKKNGTLTNENDGRVWRFTVTGNTMTGTLTMPDKTVYRRVTLKKEE